ncbi:proline/glycine betaine ABC transporter ATP-binding protein [Rhodobacter veldkampii DSM 11550]|uniref:Quaternary amine transport ATP-binding protein n=1 Tax=Phaeovulum veldkampii DSM 11550 TaxID=1185920 RepID=A0A2T4JA15_9RHOB|nr:glycine betaine/L-proline ABC transporter ATP-binding protein [Phaeovulum veldkampii]MBK5946004.1 proline/glycine betaine ABC transporter ATP-binding protein [Phaeovulum veldkampii DSM 11550]PTE14667.1 proline/glycine betaine ABC transporter ATP-binding protein [Phaeovulum veldkampii DSM 11550]TDQ53516.1 glycine betaine/proline transport system ATP-binding protein [Phaeovulum veldkampii DSM 11550]
MTEATPILPVEDDDEAVTGRSGIEIRNLYKIFGPEPERYIAAVKAGLTKTDLNRKHGHVLGLTDISLSIPPGRITVIMGLSGSGKSTLIRHINGLIAPTTGEVIHDGADVCRMTPAELRDFRRHKTAMVFQKFALLPHRTVLENTCYGLDIQGVPRRDSEPVARHWIVRVGLKGYEGSYPSQLSGGMQQRVGLARALANDADILLMDEAFSALDPLIRLDMQAILLELQSELHKTIVFITHDLDEALRLGDRIAILRDGRLEQVGTGQDIVLRPANDYIAAFVREVNRARVIRAATVARPVAAGEELPQFSVPGTEVLETVARHMTTAGVNHARVLGRQGQLRGTIAISDVLTAMVTPATAPAGPLAKG